MLAFVPILGNFCYYTIPQLFPRIADFLYYFRLRIYVKTFLLISGSYHKIRASYFSIKTLLYSTEAFSRKQATRLP